MARGDAAECEKLADRALKLDPRIPQAHANLQAGKWDRKNFEGTELYGKSLGIIGMGRIGQGIARRGAHGFGMKVIYHDPFPPPADVAAALGAEPRAKLEQLLELAGGVPEGRTLKAVIPGGSSAPTRADTSARSEKKKFLCNR